MLDIMNFAITIKSSFRSDNVEKKSGTSNKSNIIFKMH